MNPASFYVLYPHVPMFQFTDLAAFAAKEYKGDRVSAIEAILRSSPNVKYKASTAYSDAKIFVAWWVAALARKLPADRRYTQFHPEPLQIPWRLAI